MHYRNYRAAPQMAAASPELDILPRGNPTRPARLDQFRAANPNCEPAPTLSAFTSRFSKVELKVLFDPSRFSGVCYRARWVGIRGGFTL
jgi:hypothetical protein